ncbi:MAG: replicative DNA helicase [Alistipes sp.]|nr:replicative DNA helicase [Alistipes sp.]
MAKDYKASQRNRESYNTLVPEAEMGGLVPPQAVELEEAVLGALMLESDSVTIVQEYLTEDSFYTEEHKIIYHAINELATVGKPVDIYTVSEYLKSNRQLTKVGGALYLSKLTQKIGAAANVEFHARIIAQKHVQRELISSAIEIQRRSYDSATDVTDLIGFAESSILRVTEGHIKRSVQDSASILDKAIKQIEEAGKNDSRYSGVCTGFSALDNVTLGWQPSDLIIVAARPSMGKTAFVLSMARNMAIDYQSPVAFFSLEMSSTQLMTRLIVAETGLDSKMIRSGRLTPADWNHLMVATKPLGHAKLFIDDTPALSIFEFRSKARRLHVHHGIKIIIVDYLQLMTAGNMGGGANGNREQEVAFISRTLKAIAKELNVPIIALSQLSRNTESRGGTKRPQLSDLRESGAIEQDADVVAFIHRPEYYGFTNTEDGQSSDGIAEIILAKHRNGEVTDVRMRFIKNQARFADLEMVVQAPKGEQYDNYDSAGSPSQASPLQNMNGADEFAIRTTPVAQPNDEVPF